MSGAPFEATLEFWASSLRAAKARMRLVFGQERMARSAGLFLDGLLGHERRKSGWMRAEAAGDPGPWRQQAVLGRGRWEADALRDVVRETNCMEGANGDEAERWLWKQWAGVMRLGSEGVPMMGWRPVVSVQSTCLKVPLVA